MTLLTRTGTEPRPRAAGHEVGSALVAWARELPALLGARAAACGAGVVAIVRHVGDAADSTCARLPIDPTPPAVLVAAGGGAPGELSPRSAGDVAPTAEPAHGEARRVLGLPMAGCVGAGVDRCKVARVVVASVPVDVVNMPAVRDRPVVLLVDVSVQ